MKSPELLALWDAVNEYAAACGGDTGNATIGDRRMNAVVGVERAAGLIRLVAEAAMSAGLEEGVRGKEGVWPSWVYEARGAIRHRDENLPWLPDLLAALGWQGGTIYEAMSAVRRLVEADKKRAVADDLPRCSRCMSPINDKPGPFFTCKVCAMHEATN